MNNKIMKLTTIALAAGFALFGTFALAKTDRSVAKKHRGTVSRIDQHPSYGNPGGPAYAVPGWTDEQTQYWIDSASGPKG
jgi:putative alpha-1,2-mannosidase